MRKSLLLTEHKHQAAWSERVEGGSASLEVFGTGWANTLGTVLASTDPLWPRWRFNFPSPPCTESIGVQNRALCQGAQELSEATRHFCTYLREAETSLPIQGGTELRIGDCPARKPVLN